MTYSDSALRISGSDSIRRVPLKDLIMIRMLIEHSWPSGMAKQVNSFCVLAVVCPGEDLYIPDRREGAILERTRAVSMI